MTEAAALAAIKLSMRITADAYDSEILNLINAALLDLGLAGVEGDNVALGDPLVLQAVTTYCRMNFGEPDQYERLKRSYDEQKAQMSTATGYTLWGAN